MNDKLKEYISESIIIISIFSIILSIVLLTAEKRPTTQTPLKERFGVYSVTDKTNELSSVVGIVDTLTKQVYYIEVFENDFIKIQIDTTQKGTR